MERHRPRRHHHLYTAARKEGATWIVDRPLVQVRADVSADFAAAAARHHEVLWAWIHRQLDLTPPHRPPRATLRIAADREGYQADLGSATWSRGWYRWQWRDGRLREHCLHTFIEFPIERDFNRFYHPILVHEAVHLVLQAHAGEHVLPELLNEGLAAYLQSFNPFDHPDVLPCERAGRTIAGLPSRLGRGPVRPMRSPDDAGGRTVW